MSDRQTLAGISELLIGYMGGHSASLLTRDEAFNELALALFRLQFAGVPVYRSYCESKGSIPTQVAHWTQIPAIPTRAFKEFELTSLPVLERRQVFRSSGTTGELRSCHYHSSDSLRVYEASVLSWFKQHLLGGLGAGPAGADLLALTPPGTQAPDSSLVHMFEAIRRAYPLNNALFVGRPAKDNSWSVDISEAIFALRRASNSERPIVLLGPAFSFVHLLEALAREGQSFRLPRGSRAMETGGYKGRSRAVRKEELHEMISDRLGIPGTEVISEYGMSELSSQAYDRVAGTTEQDSPGAAGPERPRYFQFPPWARVQVVSTETGREVADGQFGLVRVLDLANVYSLSAVQTEDLAIQRGAGFELLGRAAEAEPRGCSLMMQDRQTEDQGPGTRDQRPGTKDQGHCCF